MAKDNTQSADSTVSSLLRTISIKLFYTCRQSKNVTNLKEKIVGLYMYIIPRVESIYYCTVKNTMSCTRLSKKYPMHLCTTL